MATRKVKMTCSLNGRHKGFVYSQIHDAETDELLVSATIDYCIATIVGNQYEVVNMLQVLYWLHSNVEFHPFTPEQYKFSEIDDVIAKRQAEWPNRNG